VFASSGGRDLKLDAVLLTRGFAVERPPSLWEADVQDEAFIRLLSKLMMFVLNRRKNVSYLTLRVSNVVIEADAGSEHVPGGDYVALTVRGRGETTAELEWPNEPFDPFGDLEGAAATAKSVLVYTRGLGDKGSITALFRRSDHSTSD
jgi:hypothetical protein